MHKRSQEKYIRTPIYDCLLTIIRVIYPIFDNQ